MGNIQDPASFRGEQRARTASFVVAQLDKVPLSEMSRRTRGRPHVARSRQIAIYVARSVFGMSNRELAQDFGRDASTIRHACERIEALRAQSADFDAMISYRETMVRHAVRLEQ